MHKNKSKETIDTRYFPSGNHKKENPTTSLEIEWAPMATVKPKDKKDDLQQLFSLSLTWESFSSLTHALEWVSVCVMYRNEESLTSIYIILFTLFPLQQVSLT